MTRMTRSSMTGALVMLAVGCGQPPAIDDDIQACDGRCIADPAARCVAVADTCQDGAQCRSGLSCVVADPRSACHAGDDLGLRCRPHGFGRLDLQTGFGVGGMPISLDQVGATPGVVWQAPHGAEFVACALFSCNPSFVTIGPSPTAAHELKKISNFEQCVLLFGAAPADQSAFALVDENAYQAPERCRGAEPGRQIVAEIAVACWAYDTTSLVAASDLVHVPGALLSSLSAIPHDRTCASNGDACYDAEDDRFGVCLAGACRSRCTTAVDCSIANEASRPVASCDWSCVDVPDTELRACVPRS